jgi:hypothetical protein
MSYTFLLDAGEESSAESFSAIPAFVLSRSNPIAEKYSSNGSETASCPDSQFGMMCGPSMENRGEEGSMSSAGDSHAKILPPGAQRKQDLKENEAGFGQKCSVWFAKWDRVSSSWRTPQIWLFEDLEEFCQIWPRWGMMRDMECFPLRTLEHDTSVKGSGCLPTITKSNAQNGLGISNNLDNLRMNLDSTKSALMITGIVGWRWPIRFLEAMMGWPIGWTLLAPLETDRFQQWLSSHGKL